MWSIYLLDNEVKLNKKQAIELSKNKEYMRIIGNYYEEPKFDSVEEMLDEFFEYDNTTKSPKKYRLMFNSDHMEHMDYMNEEEITNTLKEMQVKGDITFSSSEGDNAGDHWGYRFDGKGGMKTLSGVVTFMED